MRMGVPPDPLVVFPAKHAEVGDLVIWRPRVGASSIGTIADVDVAIGDIIFDNVVNFDFGVDLRERGKAHHLRRGASSAATLQRSTVFLEVDRWTRQRMA
jgi:hypothetical protein